MFLLKNGAVSKGKLLTRSRFYFLKRLLKFADN
jgi:hypothetical protein